MPANRKSDELHELHGTESQANPDAPPVEANKPKVPRHLSPDAKKIFRDICRKLQSRRALTAADGPLIEMASQLMERHRRAMQHVQEQGEVCKYTRLDSNGQPHEVEKRNLWLDIAVECESRITSLLDRLGFTPMNRPKVQPTKNAAGDGIVFR